jgi:DtxR family Mn-dependent transcriptional regulator
MPHRTDPVLSQAVEDYLKTIYKLQHEGTAALSEIARAMEVSAASVTNMMKRLAEMRLVEYKSYRGVSLTAAGEKIALEIIRHHRLLETYLREVMGYAWAQLHEEAEHLEHHISEEFEDRMEAMLGYPTHDPHGDPIPTRDGHLAPTPNTPLSSLRAGEQAVVYRVADQDPAILHHLEAIGLMPRVHVEVRETPPDTPLLTIRIAGQEHTIASHLARQVFVEIVS